MKKLFLQTALTVLAAGILCATHAWAEKSAASAAAKHSRGELAELRVVSWNVQTFFDAVADGTEYAEFKGAKSRWNEKRYLARLERLASALRTLDADLVVLEELEKPAQLYDIYNQLAGTFRLSALYAYGCFASEAGAAIGCGVLSRYPIDGVCVHSLDIGTSRTRQPALRPLLELRVQRGGRTLALFVCHWKSKLGAESGVWRAYQERQLADCMARAVASGVAALACGDFNQDITEFALLGGRETGGVTGAFAAPATDSALVAPVSSATDDASVAFPTPASAHVSVMPAMPIRATASDAAAVPTAAVVPPEANVVLRGTELLFVHSPWLATGDVYADGSYWYKGAWERIDNFFVCGKAELRAFCVERGGDWADADGRPVRYDVWSGTGFSDHLPIRCTVAF